MSLINLSNLETHQFKAFLDSFDNVLCDCDGVIWHLGVPLPEVDQSISKLKQLGKKVYFVTNNSYVRLPDICDCLRKCNLDVDVDDIINPCLAIISYFKKIKFSSGICILGSNDFKQAVKSAGFNVVEMKLPNLDDGCILGNPKFLDGLSKDLNQIGAVIFDVDLTLSYLKLLKVTVCLQNPDVLFLLTCPDKTFPMGRKITAMGPDYFIRPIKDITNREPLLFGKPGMPLNEYLVEKCKISNPSRTLFIGDNLECDIEFASKCGYQTLLVLTGVAKLDHIDSSTESSKIPDYYINGLGDLHKLIKSKLDLKE